MASDDPECEEKRPTSSGYILIRCSMQQCFALDEKTAIQALNRHVPVLPLSQGCVERHGFEYYHHGTLSLYAALDVKTGKAHGMTAPRDTSQ